MEKEFLSQIVQIDDKSCLLLFVKIRVIRDKLFFLLFISVLPYQCLNF